jgi:hypothetical protein
MIEIVGMNNTYGRDERIRAKSGHFASDPVNTAPAAQDGHQHNSSASREYAGIPESGREEQPWPHR